MATINLGNHCMALNKQLFDGIVTFHQVVSAGSFTAAANESDHSTSYFSKEVSKLEERLGIRLLNRTTRSLSLTPEGEVYYQQCQQMIQDAEDLESLISGKRQTPKGTLRVSSLVGFGLNHISPLLNEFLQRYPEIRLEFELNDRTIDMVSEGYDVVIRGSAKLEDSSLVSRQLVHSEGITLAAPSYLEKYGTPESPQELSQHKTISYSNLATPELWPYTDEDGKEYTVKVQSQALSNSSQLEIELCKQGLGIMRMPRFNLCNEIENGELVELFPNLPKNAIGIYVIYASKKHLSAKVRCFIDFLFEKLSAEFG